MAMNENVLNNEKYRKGRGVANKGDKGREETRKWRQGNMFGDYGRSKKEVAYLINFLKS